MSILDIENVDVSKLRKEMSPRNRLPQYIRDAGFFPNLKKIKVGDLILVSPRNPDVVQRMIQKNQGDSYSVEDAIWTHAAVYIGNGSLCEATISGVKEADIYKYLEKYLVKIRRSPIEDQDLQVQIAIGMLRRLGQRYSISTIIGFILDKARGSWIQKNAYPSAMLEKKSCTCSRAYYDAYFEATGHSPLNSDRNRVSPADLSNSNRLTDVSVGWVRLPNVETNS